MGRECAAFEEQFADYIGTKHAVMVNSGSSANLLMVAALTYAGILRPGAKVAVPAVSWSTTYAPLIQFGYELMLVDVDASLCIDPEKIPASADLVFAVNLLGNPCDFGRIRWTWPIIEDNCESLGAEYQGQKCGSHGLMGSHSLFFSHHISAMEGGVITTDDAELHRILVSLRAHGWTRDWPESGRGFHESFQFAYPGYSVRPTEVQGAIARVQMEKLPEMLEIRRENGEAYDRLIGHQRLNGRSSYFGFAVLSPRREELLKSIPFEARPIVAGDIRRHPMMRYADTRRCAWRDGWIASQVDHEGFFIGNNPIDLREPIAQLAALL